MEVYAFPLCYLPGVGVLAMLLCFIGVTYTFPSCSACGLVDKINLREERGSPDCILPSGFIISEVYCILILNQVMNSFIIQEIIVCVCVGGVFKTLNSMCWYLVQRVSVVLFFHTCFSKFLGSSWKFPLLDKLSNQLFRTDKNSPGSLIGIILNL